MLANKLNAIINACTGTQSHFILAFSESNVIFANFLGETKIEIDGVCDSWNEKKNQHENGRRRCAHTMATNRPYPNYVIFYSLHLPLCNVFVCLFIARVAFHLSYFDWGTVAASAFMKTTVAETERFRWRYRQKAKAAEQPPAQNTQ